MFSCYTLILELLTLISLTSAQSSTPVLSLYTTSNTPVELSASLRVDNDYRLRCQYTYTGRNVGVTTTVTIFAANVAQIKCMLYNNTAMEMATKTIETVGTHTCTADHFEITVKITKNMDPFRCDLYDPWGITEPLKSSPMPINTYTLPSKPIIGTVVTPKENQTVTYKCESKAKPPPKLNFSIDSNTVATQNITHSPALEDISLITPSNTSLVTVSVTATASMNGKMLRCQIFGHPSDDASFAETELAVIYGPNDNETDERKVFTWDGTNSSPFNLSCALKSNPSTYYWYQDTIQGSAIASQQNMAIQSSLFTDVLPGGQKELLFICTVRNDKNGGKWAQQKFFVTISRLQATPTPADGTSDPNTSSPEPLTNASAAAHELEPWVIGLIAAGAAALLIIIVITVVCVVIRKTKSPLKKKAKAAAKDDRPSESSKYVPPHSNSGLQRTSSPQLDSIIRNNYGYEANPPADYRFSQNVEQYSDVFDAKPRSRKPIALDELEMLDDAGPPSPGGAPPAYNYEAYRSDYPVNTANRNLYKNYGAPC